MQPLRATLSDPVGQISVPVEGELEAAGGSGGPRKGVFEFADADEVMQAFLDGKTFRLSTDDGDQLDVTIDSISASDRSGSSRAEFTVNA